MIKYALLLGALAIFSSCSQHQEKTVPQQAPAAQTLPAKMNVPEFDGQKAFTFLRAQTDFGPRNPNSLGHQKCLDYVAAELSHYAEKVTRQNFTHQGYGGEILTLTNIFGSFNTTASDRILLLAHWDTRPRADEEKDPSKQNQPILGANDGASGVAVLLEIARLLKQVSSSNRSRYTFRRRRRLRKKPRPRQLFFGVPIFYESEKRELQAAVCHFA
jgi:hypothetical protein